MSDSDDEASRRQHDRAETVEAVLADVREDLGRQSYPTTSEELAATYGTDPAELPNETESIGSAFRRIDEQFDAPDQAYDALLESFEGGQYADARGNPGERATWSDDRAREGAEEIEGAHQQSEERARRAQNEAADTDDT